MLSVEVDWLEVFAVKSFDALSSKRSGPLLHPLPDYCRLFRVVRKFQRPAKRQAAESQYLK